MVFNQLVQQHVHIETYIAETLALSSLVCITDVILYGLLYTPFFFNTFQATSNPNPNPLSVLKILCD